jgi:peroxiredoxin
VLETALAAQRLYAYTNRSAKERAVRANAVDVVARDGLAENAIDVGDQAPMFVLQDGMGAEVDVQVLLETGPVVLCFYRGGWCPYCNLELRAYQQQLGRIRALGATLVAISPELPDRTLSTVEVNQFCILPPMWTTRWHAVPADPHDRPRGGALPARQRQRRCGLQRQRTGQVPLPATYIIGTDGVCNRLSSVPITPTVPNEDVLAVLRDLTATAHPAPAGSTAVSAPSRRPVIPARRSRRAPRSTGLPPPTGPRLLHPTLRCGPVRVSLSPVEPDGTAGDGAYHSHRSCHHQRTDH